ncbi:hypothetical protein Pth03_15780 [Planotetraspora thailandica]|uniref:HTH marR-type domain-containing protein n=1 Tax=Planotetraspora thailandica TaxID=487172 RepID=A0A8J3V353_9ACTN|nr:MarR family transcriptional regulator [Planotetraspora thailandica]GII53189.1 hypothetical protein Pth03_15780 [Planotetraspora thailandica]
MDDTDFAVTAWRELLARHAEVSCALERELSEKHGLGLSEFELLDRMIEVAEARDTGGVCQFRVQELADQIYLSQSALSRLIARLEREGLVARAMCAADRRGVFVELTEEGRRRHAEALPTHRAQLGTYLLPHLANLTCVENAPEREAGKQAVAATR